MEAKEARVTDEEMTGADWPDVAGAAVPEDEVVLADSVGLALLVVLDTLTPAERCHVCRRPGVKVVTPATRERDR